MKHTIRSTQLLLVGCLLALPALARPSFALVDGYSGGNAFFTSTVSDVSESGDSIVNIGSTTSNDGSTITVYNEGTAGDDET